MTIQVECNSCHQIRWTEYTPNDLISENFVRVCYHCPECVSKQQRSSKPKVRTLLTPKREQASLPYKDT